MSVGADLMDAFTGIASDITGVISSIVALGVLTVALPVLVSLGPLVKSIYPTGTTAAAQTATQAPARQVIYVAPQVKH